MTALGIALALVALVGWGVGDFLIQRTTRLVGSAKALFFIGIVGFLALSPFVIPELGSLTLSDFFLLGLLSFIVIVGAGFDFEALRLGKIAVVEPVIGLEIALTVVLSIIFVSETLGPLQLFLIALVVAGSMLIVMRRFHHKALRFFEKGVLLAFLAAVGISLTSLLVGVASQAVSPLMAI